VSGVVVHVPPGDAGQGTSAPERRTSRGWRVVQILLAVAVVAVSFL
jgi:hypothetical protein